MELVFFACSDLDSLIAANAYTIAFAVCVVSGLIDQYKKTKREFLEASKFASPTFVSKLLAKCTDKLLSNTVRVICSCY